MLEMILINLKEHKDEKYSYKTLIDWIVDYITEEKLIYLKSNHIKTKLNEICKKDIEKNLDKTIRKKDVENIIKSLLQKLREEVKCEFKKISKEMLQEIINSGSIEYYSDLDEIVIIVDRDKSSFTHKQYTELVKECSRQGIKLVVTNPCFEFWLLMHFNINRKFNARDMLKNDKVTDDITYCHNILRNTFKGYQKNSYDAKLLMHKIKTAIDNEQLYCEDTIGLKTKIGSNVGKLLKELGYGE
ncbi:MAG: RloB domain-containing protein [Ruminococcus sp.]|nr:RloB domain-containing protein [Ruminococcus sp.]